MPYGMHETWNGGVSSTWQYQENKVSKSYYNKGKEITTKHSKNDAKQSLNYTTKYKVHMTHNPHILAHFKDMNSDFKIGPKKMWETMYFNSELKHIFSSFIHKQNLQAK
jgi:hypothetical protein